MADQKKPPVPVGAENGEGKKAHGKGAKVESKGKRIARLRQYLADQAMTARVDYYNGRGVRIEAPRQSIDGPIEQVGGGKRGKIKGWSKASRRRLRNALLTIGPPEGWGTYGITLTVPGPVITPEQARELWRFYSRHIEKAGLSAVWRAEVQARGALHWHLIGYGPDRLPDGSRAGTAYRELWYRAIDALGPVTYAEPYRGPKGDWKKALTGASSRMGLPGAITHAADIKTAGQAVGAWLRYLQDHASKSKQEQIGTDIGRHWGIIGRKRLVRVVPDCADKLEPAEFWRFLRAFQRLRTPSVRAARAPFGKHLGYRVRKGYKGASVYFSRPETIKRLVQWAKQLE